MLRMSYQPISGMTAWNTKIRVPRRMQHLLERAAALMEGPGARWCVHSGQALSALYVLWGQQGEGVGLVIAGDPMGHGICGMLIEIQDLWWVEFPSPPGTYTLIRRRISSVLTSFIEIRDTYGRMREATRATLQGLPASALAVIPHDAAKQASRFSSAWEAAHRFIWYRAGQPDVGELLIRMLLLGKWRNSWASASNLS